MYYNPGAGIIPLPGGAELSPSQITTLKFDPQPGASGNAEFEYTVTDNVGLTDISPATFTIPITNSFPAAQNKTNPSVASSSPLTTLVPMTATDADGMVVSFVITALPDPALGQLFLNNIAVTNSQVIAPTEAGLLQFKPVPGAIGTAIFYYSATDDQGASDVNPATFSIPVTTVNVKPVADDKTNPALAINSSAVLILPFSGSDADGTIVSFKVTSVPAVSKGTIFLNGVVIVNNQVIPANLANNISFKPSGSFAGNVTFRYSVFDNMNAESNNDATYTVPVTNQAPVAATITIPALKKGTTYSLPGLTGSDVDGTITSYKITSLPGILVPATLYVDMTGSGTYSLVTNNQVLTPAQAGRLRVATGSVIGNASFTYTATDNIGLVSASAGVYTIPIAGSVAMHPPVTADKFNAAINAAAAATNLLPLTATDVDGTIINYLILSIPPPYAGTLYFMQGGSVLTPIKIGGTQLTLTEATSLSFDPSGNYLGSIRFTYTAMDNDYTTDATPSNVIIPIVNNAPVAGNITNGSLSSSAGPTTINTLSGTDSDGSIATYIIMTIPATGEGILLLDGMPVSQGKILSPAEAARLQLDPLATFIGNATFTYTVTDNLEISATTAATFTIPVINTAPQSEDKISQVITNPIGTGQQDIPAFTGIDLDGTVNSFVIKTLPSGGTLYVNGNPATVNQNVSTTQALQLTFDPSDGYNGITSFTYAAKDNSNATDVSPASYGLVINTPPTSNNVSVPSMYANAPNTAILPLSGADDGFVQYYKITDLPATDEGTLYLNGVAITNLSQVTTLSGTQINQLSYAPVADFTGATLNYTNVDNINLIDVTPSVYNIPQKIIISGNVWNDVNGNKTTEGAESTINGTNAGAGLLTGSTLYANMVDANNIVLATTPVQANGSYLFGTVSTNSKITLQLSTNQGTVNSTKPTTLLPVGWATTGENVNGSGFNDTIPDSEIVLTANNSNIITQDFGIEKLPETALSSHAAGGNPGAYFTTTINPMYFVTNTVGSSPNTMDYHSGTINSIRITAFPANTNTMTVNGIIYRTSGICPVAGTCTNWPAGGVTVPFTDGAGPSQSILIDPIDGAVPVKIFYAARDNAGKEDPTPGYAEIIYSLILVPVRLENFTAAPQGNNVNLTWTIDAEINIDRYEAEFSTNGTDFSRIGSRNATGNRLYNLLHTAPIRGINYYRLKIFELDGTFSYSDIKKVIFNKTGSISIYPNPTKDIVNINFTGMGLNKTASVRIIGTDGRVLLERTIPRAGANESIDIRHLAAGSYIIRVETEEGNFNKLLELVK